MPSFFMRLRSVLALMPSRAAAPLAPSMRHAVASSASRMWRRWLAGIGNTSALSKIRERAL
jgi:hypothetical protein